MTSWDDQQQLVATALERFGRLDVFFANAGFGAKRGFLEESVEHWKAMVDTNVLRRGAVDPRLPPPLPRAERRAPAPDELGRGPALALTGSLYSCTKHAVTAMGEALRQEVADTDIKVTLIEPGMVDTPFFDEQAERRAGARRHRARGHVRADPAAPRGRERGADQAYSSGGLSRLRALAAIPTGTHLTQRDSDKELRLTFLGPK